MTYTQNSLNITLFTLALLSLLFGMVLFELLYFTEHLPAFGLLPAFFAVGLAYKGLEQLSKREPNNTLAPRIVTVEFDWSRRPQEAY